MRKIAMPLLVLLLLAELVGAASASARPIHFQPGHTHARIWGYLRGIHSQALFYFYAHAGRHVRVKITGQGPTRGTVTYPNGQQNGSPGGVVFDEIVHQTGAYHLRVTESQMGSAWSGPFHVDVWR